MAQTNRERLKQGLLLAFVAASIGLVGLIWAEGLTADRPATPGYYRDTFRMNEDIYLTVTAEALEFQQSLEEGTPPATAAPSGHGGSGSGQGQGRGAGARATETPTPTPGG